MARKKTALRILYPEEQRYACRDCPARCCRGSWQIPIPPEVAYVALQDPELQKRLVGRAPGIIARGSLPMIEKDRQLQCVFLDEDLLCGLQKRHGHESLPPACQAFPFGFLKNEESQSVTLLSQYCPSIRDNYGEPLSSLIEDKWQQVGGARPLAPRMGLRSGRTLGQKQYATLVRAWQEVLQKNSPVQGVVRAYELSDQFDEALPESAGKDPSLAEVERALSQVQNGAGEFQELPRRKGPNFSARLFYAHLLGSLSYPSRVVTETSAQKPSWWKTWGSWTNQLSWFLGVGSVDLLHVSGRVRPGKINRVERFLSGPEGARVSSYLVNVLERRQAFVQQTYLTRSLVDLGLMVALISRFARARALGEGRLQVNESDVKEGLGVADLLIAHQADAEQTTVLAQLRLQLMSDPSAFRAFLASEA